MKTPPGSACIISVAIVILIGVAFALIGVVKLIINLVV
jgi:hypothetical protein